MGPGRLRRLPLAETFQKHVNEAGVEGGAGFPAELFAGFGKRDGGRPVRRRQTIEGPGDSDDPGEQRNPVSNEPARMACPIVPFMVMGDDLQRAARHSGCGGDPNAEPSVQGVGVV